MVASRFTGSLGALLALAGCVLCFGGCGGTNPGDTGECNSNPFSCGSGTTCTISDCTCTTQQCTNATCTPHFACLTSVVDNTTGAECDTKVGQATCGDGLTCIVESGMGVCTPYCDESQPCPSGSGLVCAPKTIELGPSASYPVINVCQVPSPDGGIVEIDAGRGGPPPPPKPEGGLEAGVDQFAPPDMGIVPH